MMLHRNMTADSCRQTVAVSYSLSSLSSQSCAAAATTQQSGFLQNHALGGCVCIRSRQSLYLQFSAEDK
jgi:hypothetical protein